MKKFNFISQAVLTALIAVLSVSSAFAAEGGSDGTRGGGDADSAQIRQVLRWVELETRPEASRYLIEFLNNFESYRNSIYQPQTPIHVEIHELIAAGIIEDIKAAKYEAKPYCADENGVERAASTQKVDLRKSANKVGPSICINVKMLARLRVGYIDFMGLLFHEHARHFGKEDTDAYGLHPLAEFYVQNYTGAGNPNSMYRFPKQKFSFRNSILIELPSLKKIETPTTTYAAESPYASDSEDRHAVSEKKLNIVSTELSGRVPEVVVTSMQGSCKGLTAQRRYKSDVWIYKQAGPKDVSVQVGSRIPFLPFDVNEKLGSRSDRISWSKILFVKDKQFGDGDLWLPACKVTYHIEFNGQSSEPFKTSIYSTLPYMEGKKKKNSFSQLFFHYQD